MGNEVIFRLEKWLAGIHYENSDCIIVEDGKL